MAKSLKTIREFIINKPFVHLNAAALVSEYFHPVGRPIAAQMIDAEPFGCPTTRALPAVMAEYLGSDHCSAFPGPYPGTVASFFPHSLAARCPAGITYGRGGQ